jgi:ABC-type transport system substrate-binding protein
MPTAITRTSTSCSGSRPIELDHAKREALLRQMQQLVHEKVTAAPIWQLAGLSGVGPRVGESTLGSMAGYPWTSPYEDLTPRGA